MKKNVLDGNVANHISFLLCPEIEEICKSLFTYTPIRVFEYSRVYPDGSRTELSNHAEHMENAFITRAKMSCVYTPVLIPVNQSYLLVPSWIETMRHPSQKNLQLQLYSQHEIFGIGNEFAIIKRHKKYVEYFHFYAASHSPGIENFYMNNIEILEKFALYFVNTARTLIAKADNDRLLKPWRNEEADSILNPTLQKEHFDFNQNKFIHSIRLKRLFLTIDGREVYLTKRELDCANLLIQGKTNLAISESLFISHRTVESHIESLKLKTNCNNRKELISFLIVCGLGR